MMTNKKKSLIIAGALLTLSFLAATMAGFLEILEVKVSDTFFSWRPVDPRICDKVAVVEITDFCCGEGRVGRWPWPRSVQARLVDRIAATGAKVIGLDILYSEPSDDPAQDEALERALRRAGNVFLADHYSSGIEGKRQGDSYVVGEWNTSKVHEPLSLRRFVEAARGTGLVNVDFVHDNVDGIARKMPLAKRDVDGRYLQSLSLAVACGFLDTTPVFLDDGSIRLPSMAYTLPTYPSRFRSNAGDDVRKARTTFSRSAYVNFDALSLEGNIPSVQASDLLLGEDDGAVLAGRAVLVGLNQTGVDNKVTPYGLMPGVYVQANVVRNILERSFLRRLSPIGTGLLILAVGAVTTAVTISFSVLPAVGLVVLGSAAYCLLAYHLFVRERYIVDVVPVILLALSIVLILELLEATLSLRRRIRNLQSLYELGRSFNAVLNLNELAELVLRTFLELSGADGAVLMLRTEAGDSMELEQEGSLPDWLIVSLGRKKNQREILDDLGGSPRVVPIEGLHGIEFERFGAERVVFLPLVYHDGATGCICLSGRSLSNSLLDVEERDYWLALSSIVRTAIENARLYKLATVDGLTTLYVRHFFDIAVEREFRRALRYKAPMCLLVTDVDKFKSFNDTYGHQMGDRVLRLVARECKACVRNVDIAARYGGEEFAIILPDTGIDGGELIAERIRKRIEELRIEHHGETIRITISIGVSSTTSTQARTVKQFIGEADRALYRAKESGRNRVCIFDPAVDSEEGNGDCSTGPQSGAGDRGDAMNERRRTGTNQ